jgi:hypothetical protein
LGEARDGVLCPARATWAERSRLPVADVTIAYEAEGVLKSKLTPRTTTSPSPCYFFDGKPALSGLDNNGTWLCSHCVLKGPPLLSCSSLRRTLQHCLWGHSTILLSMLISINITHTLSFRRAQLVNFRR